jgi:hypothetical protein
MRKARCSVYPFLAEARKDTPQEYYSPLSPGEVVCMLGEISNMPDHCVFARADGTVHFGFHPQDFRKLTEDEA